MREDLAGGDAAFDIEPVLPMRAQWLLADNLGPLGGSIGKILSDFSWVTTRDHRVNTLA